MPLNHVLQAGGFAGTAVDLSLFPLDTLKTRLQSEGGFFKNGGWSSVYKGVGSVVAGSAPAAALFFVTYEHVKSSLQVSEHQTQSASALHHMTAASLGEISACAVRVPTEVIKQRAQASQFTSSWLALRHIFTTNLSLISIWKELYRGWGITIVREIPFTVIQFPLWEAMKAWRGRQKGQKANFFESAIFGSISGGIAAAATTPLDVLKTRLILAKQVCVHSKTFQKKGQHGNFVETVRFVNLQGYHNRGGKYSVI
jgi:solute carrier family 25 S-adenosylmethionine transporter 26